MQITVLQHEVVAGPGLLSEFVRYRKWPTECVLFPETFESICVEALAGQTVVVLGSPHSVKETAVAWIARERAIVREMLRSGIPVFGICFGAQLLAVESGGSVRCLPAREAGWREVDTADSVWRGPWFRWHEESCLMSPDVQTLAHHGDLTQVFTLPAALGVQFHPEVGANTLREWAASPYFQHPDRRASIDRAIDYATENAAVIRDRAFALFARVFSILSPQNAPGT